MTSPHNPLGKCYVCDQPKKELQPFADRASKSERRNAEGIHALLPETSYPLHLRRSLRYVHLLHPRQRQRGPLHLRPLNRHCRFNRRQSRPHPLRNVERFLLQRPSLRRSPIPKQSLPHHNPEIRRRVLLAYVNHGILLDSPPQRSSLSRLLFRGEW